MFIRVLNPHDKHSEFFHRYVAAMNKCFSTMFFVVFVTASMLICLLGFQVIVVSKKTQPTANNNNINDEDT
jgi:hypothetical protein